MIRFGFYPDYNYWLFIEYGHEETEETFQLDFVHFHRRIADIGIDQAQEELWWGHLVSSADVAQW